MIRITLLGTAAARPTVPRNVTALTLQREGDVWLLDCGEGTQRQMMRYGTGFALKGIFFTHLHGDHTLGLPGLLRTLALQGRTDPLPLFGPPGSERGLHHLVHLGDAFTGFPVPITELAPGEGWEDPEGEYCIEAVAVEHGVRAVGYRLREYPRPGRFDVERARALGVPEGPLFGKLHRGESIEVEGRPIDPAEVVGPPRPGRSVVFTGDTLPVASVVEAARGAALLIHDATFGEDEADRARETYHSTAAQAADVARQAGVERLILTHVSARYSANAHPLELEAAHHFPGARVGHDGLVVEIGYGGDHDEGAA